MERIIDIQIQIDGIVLQEGENPDEIIKKIEEIVDTIYPIKWEVIQEEFHD